uniref:Nuclear pore complex protein Nup153 n=1 Tax=Drosophila rhopaloa TaxID=1041015 RepID=A0A6P4F2Q9_DRORH
MEDGQEQRDSSQAELAKLHPMTPLKELPEEEEEEEDESSAGALLSRSNNNSIMGKMKMRVSSILPASLSGWFSPSSKGGSESAAAASSSSANLRQPRQSNGRSATKRKRGRRRIMLAEADADAADDLDDGTDAKGLNYEEVALADNIAEHDLAAEDEQTRRSEYNVFLLRKRREAVAAAGGEEDEAEEDDLEEEEDEGDEEDDDEEQENLLQAAAVHPKRRRLELETTVNLPNMRRLPLLSSTPAGPLVAATSSSPQMTGSRSSSQLAPHRRNHLNLYGSQRQREPAYNFFTGNEAAEGSTGDLPHSIRRSLNIPFGGSSAATSHNSLSSLPNHKRPSLLGQRTNRRDLTMDETGTGADGDRLDHLLRISKTNNNISNNNNNNNNVIKSKSRRTELSVAERGAGGDSQSEGDINDYHDNIEGNDGLRPSHHNSNSNLEFYGNLQSTKSIFNRSSAAAQPAHRNSTWSLNSLNQRRRFNASIYGSTSALSDSRLLSRSASTSGSASASSSPFYQGRTTFGGNSANNRIFSRSNLSSSAASSTLAINSAGSSPAHTLQSSLTGGIGYGMKPVDMRPSAAGNLPESSVGQSGSKKSGSGLSNTTLRILNLLDSYSTPLIDAKRMGSTLKEHQSSRQQRQGTLATPYPRPTNSQNASRSVPVQSPASELAELRSNKLLVPTMQQLLERRRLHRVTQNSRDLVQNQSTRVRTENSQEKANQTTPYVAPVDQPASHSHHTNKMRSRLSHQTRSKEPRADLEEAPLPLDLPQISFPDMASTPKFDLVIKPTAPVVSKPASTVPTISNKSSSSNIFTNSKQLPNFLVNPQQTAPVVNFSANGSVAPISKSVGRTFSFSEPTPLSDSRENCVAHLDVRRNYFFPAPASLDEVQQPPQPTMNGAPPLGFGEQFKKSSKEWECDVCMVRNKAEVSKCVACETAKPGAIPALAQAPPSTPAIVPLGSGFGDRFKKSSTAWECDACMLSNKAEATKCIACETPRKTAAPKINNFPLVTNNLSSGSGFGTAFKPKANTWECQTCLVMNKSEAAECIACQTPNSQARNAGSESVRSNSGSSSSSTSSSGSLSGSSSGSSASSSAAPSPARSSARTSGTSSPVIYSIGSSSDTGFLPGSTAETAKPDAGFQKLVAAQKAASWDCDACMAQNDMSRIKCICCEQLKPGATGSISSSSVVSNSSGSGGATNSAASSVPKFSFGFATVKEVVKPAVETTTAPPAAATTQFSFGFGQTNKGKDVADSKKTEPTKGFTFGVSKVEQPKTVSFETDSKETKATPITTEATAPLAAPAPLAGPAPLAAPALQFVFKAPTTTTTASSITTTSSSSTTTTTPALGGFSFGSASSSSTVSSSTASSSANPTAVKPMFSFSGAGSGAGSAVSSTSSQLPMPKAGALSFGVSSNTITTTTTSTTAFALTPTATPAPAAATSASAPAGGFSFGSQAKPPAVTQAAGAFFFGQTPAATPAAPASTSVGSIFGSAATTATSSSSSFSGNTTTSTAAVVPSFAATTTPQLFGSWGDKKAETSTSSATKPFAFGSTSGSGTMASPSFGWPSNGAAAKNNSIAVTSAAVSSSSASTMATPVFGSSSMFGATSSSTTSTSSSPFGSTATTAAATPAAASLGGNGPLTGVFGNVGNSLVAPGAPAATAPAAAAPLANIFGNVTPIAAAAPVFGSSTSTSGGFGAAAASANTALPGSKLAFNFGGADATTPAPSSAPFKFGTTTNAPPIKPAFNFTGSAATPTPQATSFNFSANTAATSLSGGDLQSASRRQLGTEFADGAPQDSGSHAPPAAPVEMASQSAVEIAAAPAEAAIGLGIGLGVPVGGGGGGRTAKEVAAVKGEEQAKADSNSRMKGLVQRRSRRFNEQYQQQQLELKLYQVNKYRFVRRSSTDAEIGAAGSTRSRGRQTEQGTGVGDGGGHAPAATPPFAFRPTASTQRLTRNKFNSRIGRKPTAGDQEENPTGGSGAGAGAGTASGHVLRSRYKLVRRRSCGETTPQVSD